MKITNKLNLPQAIVDAVQNDAYSRGGADISVTELIDSPRIRTLKKAHDNEIEEDASDRIWSLYGQSVHTILERANRTAIAERRLSMEIEGWVVSGGMDVYEEEGGFLRDYKMTSVWSLIFGDRGKWEAQLNCYAVILRHHGHKVERIQAIALLRDWSKNKAADDPSYPQAGVVNIELPVWEPDVAEKYVRERVILHKQASLSALPECSKEERWGKDDTWAVMKHGQKRAVKLYDNEKLAKMHANGERGLYVEFRQGKSGRCERYCQVAQFCDQWKQESEPPVRTLTSSAPIDIFKIKRRSG